MRRLIKLLMICSLLGCDIDRPNTDICVVNSPGQHQKCYNIQKDYNDDGTIKGDAKPIYKPAATVEDLNKNICTNPDGWANLKAYMKKLREACKEAQ